MERRKKQSARQRKPKRTALQTITNDDRHHRPKARKVDRGINGVETVDIPTFKGGLLCELRLACGRGDSNIDANKFTVIDTVNLTDSYGGFDVIVCGRDATGSIKKLRVDYWGWQKATGLLLHQLSYLLECEVIMFVPLPDSNTSSPDRLPCIDASRGTVGISVGVRLLPAAFQQSSDAHAMLSILMRLLLRIPKPASKETDTHATDLFEGSQFNASALYGAIKPHGTEPMMQGEVDGLVCTLRPFQKRSVQWMLSREQCSSLASTSRSRPQQRNDLFRALPVVDQATGCTFKVFVNQWDGRFQLEPPAPLQPIAGGCLCEEMGLGKTVEVIACVLRHKCPHPSHPRPLAARIAALPKQPRINCITCGTVADNPHDDVAESYRGIWVQCDGCASWMHGTCISYRGQPDKLVCGECLRRLSQQEVPGTSRATLIVCPDSILKQWQEEMKRHVVPGALKVIDYGGQSASITSSLRGMPVTAADLAAADVVITTYSVLRHDLDFEASAAGNGRPARRSRKYPVMPSPLTRLTWWRVILDEAQMVESANKAAEMAASLRMVNRWCVTGTPIGNGGVSDVYGLVRFLQMEPWSDKRVWESVVQRPVEAGCPRAQAALLQLLQPSCGGIMWRTSKSSVAKELGIPAQEAVVLRLKLTPVEWHAYRRCHKETAEHAHKVLPEDVLKAIAATGTVPPALDRTLTNREADALFPKLVRLRKTCCHPQIGQRGGIAGGLGGGGAAVTGAHAPKTMSAVLNDLVERDRVEAEEAQRVLMSVYNGLAGVALLQGRKRDAAAWYGKVLEHVRENAGVCAVDRLQQMHALTNLGDVSKMDPKAVQTLGMPAADIQRRARALKMEYLRESFGNMAAASSEYASFRSKLTKAAEQLQAIDAGQFLAGAVVDKANAWWWTALGRVSVACEPDTKRVQAERAVRARIAAAEAKQRAAEKAAEAAAARETPESTPSKAGTSRGSPAKRSGSKKAGAGNGSPSNSPGKSPAKSPGKARAKAAGKGGAKAKGKKKRKQKDIDVDMWDSDDSDEEEEEESSEEDEPVEEEEEGIEERVVRFFKEQLDAATNHQNALSVRGRFDTVLQLRDVLRAHFEKLRTVQNDVLGEIERLDPICRAPPQELHERAGACEQCHGDNGMPGLVCAHCELECQVVRWEARLFRFTARALGVGAMVSEEQALEVYRQELLRGGAAAGAAPPPAQRAKTGIASVAMTHQDNEHVVLLQAVVTLLRKPAGEVVSVPSTSMTERVQMLHLAQAQLRELAASRALFLKARQAIVRQRGHLHAHDEVAMCTARLALHGSSGYSPMREQLYLHRAEVPVRVQEMTVEMVVAEGDYKAAIGQLRYALNLQRSRGREVPSLAAPSPAAAAAEAPAEPAAGEPADEANLAEAAQDAPATHIVPAAAASSDTSSAVVLDDSDDDCVIVEGLGVTRGTPDARRAAPQAPRKAPTAAFTAAAPDLATPSWDAAAAPARQAGAGCSRDAGAATAAASAAAVAVPVAPRVKLGEKLEAMLRKLDEPAPPGAEECPVCNEFMVNDCMMSTCGHRWCARCHARMKKLNRGADGRLKCPLCNKGLAAREVTLVSLHDPVAADDDDVDALNNSFGTKLDAVVKCIQDTLREKPSDKMLVFSAWPDVLELLAHNLDMHRVPYLAGKSKPGLQRALDAFDGNRGATDEGVERAGGATIQRPRGLAGRRRRGPGVAGAEPRVLLLQLKQAAAGLNLVQAQHVLLIEPSTNPAVEAQAVARVHRMNQKSETRVVRFVVDGTVEAALHQLTAAKAAQMDMASSSAQGHGTVAAEPKLTMNDVAAMLFHKQVQHAAA